MNQDMHSNIKVTQGLAAQSVSSNTTVVGSTIDTQGFESLTFAIQSATLTDGTYTPALYEDDASGMGTESLVAAADLIGTVALATFAATDGHTAKKLGYRGNKRYVRLKVASTGVTTGGAIAAVALLGDAANKPVA